MKAAFALFVAALHATPRDGCTTAAFAPPPPLATKPTTAAAMSQRRYDYGDDLYTDRIRSGGRRGGRTYDDRYDDGYDAYSVRDRYGEPIFGKSNYYSRGSEDFREVSHGDRYRPRETIRDYSTPGERDEWQQRDNRGARYGWQQQYDVDRGNVRRGSTDDFRRGSALSRIQDYYTPREREEMQQRETRDGLRYGFQQQYDRDRGNVRYGSSDDFRRGSALARIQDFYTPREREMRQMRDNRNLGRGVYDDRDYDRRDGLSFDRGYERWGGLSFNRDRFGDGRDDYYDEEFDDYIPGRENRRRSSAWDSIFDRLSSLSYDRDGYDDREYDRRGRGGFDRERFGYGRDDYFDAEIIDGPSRGGRGRGGRSNAWDNIRNLFQQD